MGEEKNNIVAEMEAEIGGDNSESDILDNDEVVEDGAKDGEETTEGDDEQLESEDNPGKKADKSEDEGQEMVAQAVKSLSKLYGRELKQEEVQGLLAKSHLAAAEKIESLKNQIKDFVPYLRYYETLTAHPRFSEIKAILDGAAPRREAAEEGLDDELPPAISRKVGAMEAELRELREAREKEQLDVHSQSVEKRRKEIDEFSLEKGNEDFREMLTEYRDSLTYNPRAPMPEKLRQFSAMVDNGVDKAMAWASLNKKKLEENMRREIARKQSGKVKLPNTGKGKGGVQKSLEDIAENGNVDELVDAIRERGRLRS